MKIEHIAMYVSDLESAKDFFVNYLGGKANNVYHNKKTEFRSYFISFDDGARLEIMNKPEMKNRKKTLIAQVLFTLLLVLGVRRR